MLNITIFNKFIDHANLTHQQFCVWYEFNNLFSKHWNRWNQFYSPTYFAPSEFDKTKGAKYKNFWSVTLASTQHGWILGIARLFDPAFHPRDKSKKNPRICFDYILQQLSNNEIMSKLKSELSKHEQVIQSIKEQRDNFLAHNDAKFDNKKIKAGIENLFEWLESVITRIKSVENHLSKCRMIGIEYNIKLSKCGAEEVFSTILQGESNEVYVNFRSEK